MPYDTLQWSVTERVARLTLNRPDRLNSITVQMHGELRDALGRVEAEGARVLVLSGAGRAFCAGQDLADPAVTAESDLGDYIAQHYAPLIEALRALPVPTVAAVNGVAAGAGATEGRVHARHVEARGEVGRAGHLDAVRGTVAEGGVDEVQADFVR